MGLRFFNARQLDRKVGLYTTPRFPHRMTLFHNLTTLFHNRTTLIHNLTTLIYNLMTLIHNLMTLFPNLMILFRTLILLFLNLTIPFLLHLPSPSTCHLLPFLCLSLLPPKPCQIRVALLSIQTSLSPSLPSKRPHRSLCPLQSLPLSAIPNLSAILNLSAISKLRETLCGHRTTSCGQLGCLLVPFQGFDSG